MDFNICEIHFADPTLTHCCQNECAPRQIAYHVYHIYTVTFIDPTCTLPKELNQMCLTKPVFCKTMLTGIYYILFLFAELEKGKAFSSSTERSFFCKRNYPGRNVQTSWTLCHASIRQKNEVHRLLQSWLVCKDPS